MKRLLVWICGTLFGSTAAYAYFDPYFLDVLYGRVAGYEIGFSEKRAVCIAKRTISIRDREGYVLRGGFFGYGVGERQSGYAAVIVVSNPHWNFQTGERTPGRVFIDRHVYRTDFDVTDKSVVSVALPEFALGQISRSTEIRFMPGNRAYSYRPIFVGKPLSTILRCVRQSVKTDERRRRLYGGTPPSLP